MKIVNSRNGRVPFELDANSIVRMYLDEKMSVLEIAARMGVSRGVIQRRIEMAAVQLRNGHASQLLRNSKLTPAQRARNAAKAHDAIRGRKIPNERKFRRADAIALTRQPTQLEATFLGEFTRAGERPVAQLAVGEFNVDIALPDRQLAVEIDPGHWHSTARKAPLDSRKDAALAAAGWRVVRFSGNKIRRNNPLLREHAAALVAELLRGIAS